MTTNIPTSSSLPLDNKDVSTRFPRSVSRSVSRFKSPKPNIAKSKDSLDLGIFDWTLPGTGPAIQTSSREQIRRKPAFGEDCDFHNEADRFVPNRMASRRLVTGSTNENLRPKTRRGTTGLASIARSLRIGCPAAESGLAAALENFALEHDATTASHQSPNPGLVAYESSLALALGIPVDNGTLSLFKPPQPQSTSSADHRFYDNRYIRAVNAQTAQFGCCFKKAPERGLTLRAGR